MSTPDGPKENGPLKRSYAPSYYLIDPSRKKRLIPLHVLTAMPGIAVAVISIVAGMAGLYDRTKTSALDAELMLRYTGFQIRLVNRGNALAKGLALDLLTWGVSAPGPMVRETINVRDLPPFSDVIVPVKLENWPSSNEPWAKSYEQTLNTQPKSGYFTVVCENCARALTWVFHIPGWQTDNRVLFVNARLWPIAKVQELEARPEVSQCVDVPEGLCDRRGHPWHPSDPSWRRVFDTQH